MAQSSGKGEVCQAFSDLRRPGVGADRRRGFRRKFASGFRCEFRIRTRTTFFTEGRCKQTRGTPIDVQLAVPDRCGVAAPGVRSAGKRSAVARGTEPGRAAGRGAGPPGRHADARTRSGPYENVEIAQALERARAAAASGDQPSATASLSAIGASAFGGTKGSVLFPQTRSIGQVPKIDVASHADGVTFELRLESNEFPQYRALLKDSGTNRIIWRSAMLHARSDAPTSVLLVVPANVLESRHYSFELAGIDAAGHQTTTGNYAVQIDRR